LFLEESFRDPIANLHPAPSAPLFSNRRFAAAAADDAVKIYI
jgi:hypothetical protein